MIIFCLCICQFEFFFISFQLEPAKKHVAVVVSPLKSLVFDQMSSLRAKGLRCASLTDMKEDVKTGLFLYKMLICHCITMRTTSYQFRYRTWRYSDILAVLYIIKT